MRELLSKFADDGSLLEMVTDTRAEVTVSPASNVTVSASQQVPKT